MFLVAFFLKASAQEHTWVELFFLLSLKALPLYLSALEKVVFLPY
jgi:hypothetical protein